jgi:RNA polymerase sigma factor (sigma-70 family)
LDSLASLRNKLRRLLRSRGRTAADTDDLIQEAFVRLQAYCKDKSIEQPEAFLVRTALNLSVDERRLARNRFAVSTPLEKLSLIDAGPTPDAVLEAQQRLQRVRQALNELSPRSREVFLLHRAEGYSYGQVAQRLGISVSTVEKHMAKAALFFDAWAEKEGRE